MEAPFLKGVAYLSREEEVAALECEKSRSDRASIADIILRADEVEALNFVRRVRDEIRKWKERTSVSERAITILCNIRKLIKGD